MRVHYFHFLSLPEADENFHDILSLSLFLAFMLLLLR